MDSNCVTAEKIQLQAMKNYRRAKFLYNLILYSLTSLITFLFVTHPFWLPSINHFFLVYLPNNSSHFFNPKCFFVLGNAIVFILVGESKRTRSSNSSPVSDMYDEYIVRSKSTYCRVEVTDILANEKEEGILMQSLNLEEKKNLGNEENTCKKEKVKKKKSVRKSSEVCSEVCGEANEVLERKRNINTGMVSEGNIPTEELNKRVEAFIARVNRQRLMENSYN